MIALASSMIVQSWAIAQVQTAFLLAFANVLPHHESPFVKAALLPLYLESRGDQSGSRVQLGVIRCLLVLELRSYWPLVVFSFVALTRMINHSFILVTSNKHMNLAFRGDHATTASRTHHSSQTQRIRLCV